MLWWWHGDGERAMQMKSSFIWTIHSSGQNKKCENIILPSVWSWVQQYLIHYSKCSIAAISFEFRLRFLQYIFSLCSFFAIPGIFRKFKTKSLNCLLPAWQLLHPFPSPSSSSSTGVEGTWKTCNLSFSYYILLHFVYIHLFIYLYFHCNFLAIPLYFLTFMLQFFCNLIATPLHFKGKLKGVGYIFIGDCLTHCHWQTFADRNPFFNICKN